MNPFLGSPTPQDPGGPSLTKQAGSEAAETWQIVEKYLHTGGVDLWNRHEPRYGDFSDVGDYQTCLNRVLEAQERFDALPAEVRHWADNDSVRFLELVLDPANRAKLEEFGLVPPGDSGAPGQTNTRGGGSPGGVPPAVGQGVPSGSSAAGGPPTGSK